MKTKLKITSDGEKWWPELHEQRLAKGSLAQEVIIGVLLACATVVPIIFFFVLRSMK